MGVVLGTFSMHTKQVTFRTDNIDDELEMTMVCHRPEGLEQLEAQTNFTKQELQVLYRGFKNECPSGVVNEETFKHIYAQFFPHGDASTYAHYLFNAFDTRNDGSIKFETLPTTQYELEIVAKDMAGSEVGLTGTATATITITDRNDHAPEFTHSLFQASVNEGSTGVVVNLTVDDRDDPATGAWRAIYSIINGDPNQNFEIQTNLDNNEGMLSVVKPLDYESAMFHTLLIKVENEDPLVPDVVYGSSSTATVYITVMDVNEGPVFFPDPLVVIRRENIPVGSFVAMLNATDPDYLQTQSIRFSVLRDPADWLIVNPFKGNVTTRAILDRESPHVHNNQYTALFMATDNGSPPASGTGTLIITIEDENDNAPYIFPSVARVCEDSKDMNVVIGGRDKDIHPNTDPFKIELGKQPGLEKTWKISRINDTHSQIMLLHSLKKANYNLPLVLTDSGVPPISNNTELKVQVCTCKKNRMDCSHAGSIQTNILLLLGLVLLSILCL
ncbi:hypothetical protein cypCar_00008869 [Cyprinus carpio]|nr:hypothetical protein cypCar_00008869 [Cyprinus carpio]